MKLLHLSDLHLGKRVNEFSMLDDQAYILKSILAIIEEEQPDGVLLAGDIYDKSVPPVEAVTLLDHFLTQLHVRGIPVFLLSGNHDSAERIAFGGSWMSKIHIAPVYHGTVEPVTLWDDYGAVDIWMLPFVKPVHVRNCFPEETITSYTDAVRCAVSHMSIDPAHRTVLMTHQFVTGAQRSDSEEVSVGGTDNVDSSVFDPFDYVALGHIHAPQSVGRETVRYCGTPLAYSFSECRQTKSVTVVEMKEKGNLSLRTIPLPPLRNLRELRGTYDTLTSRAYYEGTTYPNDYLHITLTDEEDIPDAIGRLRAIYPYIMRLDYDNVRTREHQKVDRAEQEEQMLPLDLFARFYALQNNQPMGEEPYAFCAALWQEIEEEER